MRSFEDIFATVGDHRCYAPYQIEFLYQALQIASQVAGDAAEFGVYQGCTAGVIARCLEDRTVWLFDGFMGMEKVDQNVDRHYVGEFVDTSFAAVQKRLTGLPNIRYIKGWFPASVKGRSDLPSTYAFAHVDMDLYDSTRDAIAYAWPKLTIGGVMVLHDWHWSDCPGVDKAVGEFFGPLAASTYTATEGRNILAIQKRSGLVVA